MTEKKKAAHQAAEKQWEKVNKKEKRAVSGADDDHRRMAIKQMQTNKSTGEKKQEK